MLTNKVREKIKKEFIDFNDRFKTAKYPTTKDIETRHQKDQVPENMVNPLEKGKTPTIRDYTLKTTVLKDKQINYSGLKKLKTGSTDNINKEVDLCIYQIKQQQTKPYLLFCLFKEKKELLWPSVNIKGKKISNIIEYIKKQQDCTECSIEYKGQYTYNNKIQLWFKYSNKSEDIKLGTYKDNKIWALCSEIINYRKALTFPINKDVTKFFLKNNDFIYLKDDLGMIYEIPSIAYYGNHSKYIAFAAVIGVLRGDVSGPFGPYYYFGDYERAMKSAFLRDNTFRRTKLPEQIGDEKLIVNKEGLYTRGGLLRAAVFMGNATVFLNRTSDKADASNITTELAKTNNVIKALAKTRDTEGDWTKNYDSAIQGEQRIKIQTKKLVVHPSIVLQNFDQQFSLEYYYIDTSQKVVDDDYSTIIVE